MINTQPDVSHQPLLQIQLSNIVSNNKGVKGCSPLPPYNNNNEVVNRFVLHFLTMILEGYSYLSAIVQNFVIVDLHIEFLDFGNS